MNQKTIGLLVAASCAVSTAWATHEFPRQEKADIVYRALSAEIFGLLEQHPAIYVTYFGDQVGNGRPDSPTFHRLIEMSGPPGVRDLSLEQCIQDAASNRYDGPRIPRQTLLNEQRDQVIALTNSLRDIPYVASLLRAYFDMVVWDRDPPVGNGDNIMDRNEIVGLRSDAWVEYVFARAGVLIQNDIIRNTPFYERTCVTTLPFPGGSCLRPSDQFAATSPSIFINPLVEVKENSNSPSPIPPNGATSDDTPYIAVSDTLSGVSALEVWRGAPDTGQLVFKNTDDGQGVRPYNVGPLEDGQYTARAFDQAGNDSPDYRFTVQTIPIVDLTLNTGADQEIIEFTGTDNENILSIADGGELNFIDEPSRIAHAVMTRDGVPIVERFYDPVVPSAGFTIPSDGRPIPDGNYAFAVTNGEGKTTDGSFTKYTFDISISTTDSRVRVDSGTESFIVDIVVDARNTGPGVGELRLSHTENSTGRYLPAGPPISVVDVGAVPQAKVNLAENLGNDQYIITARDANGSEVQLSFLLGDTFHPPTPDFVFDPASAQNMITGNLTMNGETTATLARRVDNQNFFVPSGNIKTLIFDTWDFFDFSGGLFPLGARLQPNSSSKTFYATTGFFDPNAPAQAPGNTGISIVTEVATAGSLLTLNSFTTQDKLDVYLVATSTPGVLRSEVRPALFNPPIVVKRYLQERLTLTPNSATIGTAPPGTATLFLGPGIWNRSFKYLMLLQAKSAMFFVDSAEAIGDNPEFSITSGRAGLTVAREDPASAVNQRRLVAASAHGLRLASKIYFLDPITILNAGAKVTMAVDPQALNGINPDSLTLYYAPTANDDFRPLAMRASSPQTITAFLDKIQLDSSFAIFGSTLSTGGGGGGGGGGTPASTVGIGFAISADSSGNLWEVVGDQNAANFALSKFNSSGIFLSSVPLPGANDNGGWSVRFDDQGNALALGTSSGAQGQVVVAAYKVSGGSVLLSSAMFNSALGKNDFTLDASGDAWITGATQTSGPIDFSGPVAFSLGLWKYCPHADKITLVNTYSRGAGFDVGAGIRRDAAGHLWIIGFSQNPAPQAGRPPIDLALWEYDPTGQTLLSGPHLKEGYLNSLDNPFSANLAISSETIIVSATKLNPAGNTDLELLRFSLTGRNLLDRSWHGTGDSVPSGLAVKPDGSLIVAGRQGGEFAVWQYEADGAFTSAQTVPHAGSANGLTLLGQDTWLAVGSQASPFRFTGGTALPGTEVLVSSASADDLPPVTTLTIGGPKFQAFGLDILGSTAAITLSAADPSGIASITYRVDDETLTTYTAPFTLPQGTHIIEYGAVDIPGNAEPRKTAILAVSDFQSGAIAGVDKVRGSGSPQVTGLVQSNGLVSLSGNVAIMGDVVAGSVVKNNRSTISGTVTQGAAPLASEPIDLNLITSLAQAASSTGVIPAHFFKNGALNLDNQDILTLSTGAYVLKGLRIREKAQLIINGPVHLLVQGPIQINGKAKVNAGGMASNLIVFASSSLPPLRFENEEDDDGDEPDEDRARMVKLLGKSQTSGLFYAPRMGLKIGGDAQVGGHLFAKAVRFAGKSTVLATDGAGLGSGIKTSELEEQAIADESFSLRDAYAFPNPARNKNVTIRLQAGLADSADVEIFDVSGQKVHGGSFGGAQVIDDGNGKGPQYTYDYVWDTHQVGSGVYTFLVTARKAGQGPIRKAGKTGVLR